MPHEHSAVGGRRAAIPFQEIAPAGIIICQRVGDRIVRVGVALEQFGEIKSTRQCVGAGIKAVLVRKILNALGCRPFRGRRRLDLHQADFTGSAAPIRMETCLLPNDRFDQERINVISPGRGADLGAESPPLAGNKTNIQDQHRNPERHQK